MEKYVKLCKVVWLFENICVVGERGQITIPKVIRQASGIKSKDKLLVRIENKKMVLEKISNKKLEESLKEYCAKYAERNLKISGE